MRGRQGRSSGRGDSDEEEEEEEEAEEVEEEEGGCMQRKQFCMEYCCAKRTRESRKLM